MVTIGICSNCGERTYVNKMRLVTGEALYLCYKCLHASGAEITNHKCKIGGGKP